jgi:hypothetical protein
MRRTYILVEGHGEVDAAGNLVSRLSRELGLALFWPSPIRWKNLHQKDGILKGANFIRNKGDAGALLILRDEDDRCPRDFGPVMAGWLREARLPFPASIVLLHPEYEVLFLPCLDRMAGRPLGAGVTTRPGLTAGTTWEGSWELRRGIKEWLSDHFPPGRSYKPAQDQLAMTRLLDLPTLRSADVPSFGTLERAVRFLASVKTGEGDVYPKSTRPH